jgi:hypothetical protein
MLVALRGLEADPRVAPAGPEAVRAALDRLRPGQSADRAIERLRRVTWEPGEPLPPLRRRVGRYDGRYAVGRRKPLFVSMPPLLVGTPIELAVAIHEHQHGRIHRVLPELLRFQQSLTAPVLKDPFDPEAEAITDRRAELMYWQERVAIIGEAAVFRALDDDERRALLDRLARVPEAELHPDSRAYLVAAIEAGPVGDEEYLAIQFRSGRYGLDTLRAQWRELLEQGRTLRKLRQWVDARS